MEIPVFTHRLGNVLLIGACVLSIHAKSFAQSSYGSVVGTVKDPSGAVVPGAKTVLTDVDTSEIKSVTTDASGDYQFVNLQPGRYKVDVDVTGFSHLRREGVQVAVAVATRVDLTVAVGTGGEIVEVNEETPLLNSEDASVGQVVEGRAVSEMPLNGRNVMNLIQLAPGVVPHGQSQGQQNRSGYANYQISGGMAQEGRTVLDGAPLQTALTNGQAFVPIQDTVQEFQVMGNNVPAEYDGTLNGVINIATKGGGNQFHGNAYEFIRNRVLNANTFFNNRNKIARPPFTQNEYGANGGGPLIRNKTFFYAAWENFSQRVGTTNSFTVPTAAERTGDFSNLRSASGAVVPIYDPLTTCGQLGNAPCAGGVVTRQQFPGNIIPASRFDQTAAIMLKYWPLPNAVGAANTNANNFVVSQNIANNRNWEHLRIDQVIGSKQRMFGTFDRYSNAQPAFDWYGLGINYAQTQGSLRGMLADTYTLNPTTVIDARVAYSRTVFVRIPNTLGIDLSTIGWPSSYNAQFLKTQLPVIAPQGFSNSDGGETTAQSSSNVSSQYAGVGYFGTSLTKIAGRHTIKAGGEYSWMPTAYGQGQVSQFNFTSAFTALNPLSPGSTGSGLASYLLGLGQSGSVGNVLFPYETLHTGGVYVQDHYSVTQKLNLNVGLRWQYPGYWMERHDRQVVFQPGATNPVLSGAGLNYAGDLVLVNSARYNNRSNQNPHWDLFDPRVGLTYRFNEKNVLRSGFAITYTPSGYSQYSQPLQSPVASATTSWVPTLDGGTTAVNKLSNPFPTGINPAPGRDPSYEKVLLGTIVTAPLTHNSTQYMENWNIGYERQLGGSTVIDLSYVGTHGVHLIMQGDPNPPGGPNLDQLPDQYDSMGTQLLSATANPFFGVANTGTLAQKTVPAGQLMLPFPQYLAVYNPAAGELDAHYNALEAKLQRRFGAGGNLLVSYAWSRNYGTADTIYGHTEPNLPGGIQDYNNLHNEESVLSFDVPQIAVISYVLDLPFGKGKRFLATSNSVVSAVVSGWGVDGITTFQSGFPLPILAQPTSLSTYFGAGQPRPNLTQGCSVSKSGSAQARLQGWFNTACFTQPSSFGYGNEARVDQNIRQSGIANYDAAVLRNFKLYDRVNFMFRAEVFNMFNRVQFGPPGGTLGTAQFGVVSSQINNPRLFQFGGRITF
jgi:hypothetical protein